METDSVLYSDSDDGEREIFLLGLVTAAMAKVRYKMGKAGRAHFQYTVFCLILSGKTIQKELGFNATQSMEEMWCFCKWIAY